MAPPAFPNPPGPEDTSSRRWSWRCPAWAFVGNASVWRRCWSASQPCRTRTAPPISRLRTKAVAAMRILHAKCRRVLLGSALGCQVCETLTVGEGNARREGGRPFSSLTWTGWSPFFSPRQTDPAVAADMGPRPELLKRTGTRHK